MGGIIDGECLLCCSLPKVLPSRSLATPPRAVKRATGAHVSHFFVPFTVMYTSAYFR